MVPYVPWWRRYLCKLGFHKGETIWSGEINWFFACHYCDHTSSGVYAAPSEGHRIACHYCDHTGSGTSSKRI